MAVRIWKILVGGSTYRFLERKLLFWMTEQDSISKLNATSADSGKVGILSEQNLEITKMEGHGNLKKQTPEENESLRTVFFTAQDSKS